MIEALTRIIEWEPIWAIVTFVALKLVHDIVNGIWFDWKTRYRRTSSERDDREIGELLARIREDDKSNEREGNAEAHRPGRRAT